MNQPPVIFLAFANDRLDAARYLRNLPKEMKLIRSALETAEQAGLCELVLHPNAGLDEIIDTFQSERYQNRITIFHYGGHADGYQLLLETMEGDTRVAHAAGLVSFLASQENLQLVFLNGCSTERQAEELAEAGSMAVIGTSQSIADEAATQLAARFYQGLGRGLKLKRAWKEATDEQKIYTGKDNFRDFVFSGSPDADFFPWRLIIREGSEIIKEWNLPEASQNPLFGLPPLPQLDLPESPFRFLDHYRPEDAEIFFGRSYYIRDLFERTTSSQSAPIILFYGQSGTGKSSLLEAGLFPRLQSRARISYLSRDPALGLATALKQLLHSSTDTSSLRQAWINIEQQHQQPLLVFLDQVEECFTIPLSEDQQELKELLQMVATIFSDPQNRPEGKLVLSYRKEYHPEILSACQHLRLAREECYLKPLDRKDIIEVIMGLTQIPRLRQTYRLDIEENLPVVIADDLMLDKDSPIAPVLQILMTKMWEQVNQDHDRKFTIETYQKLIKEGILLNDFVDQQMNQLKIWNEEVENSGLVLDILNYHITLQQTSSIRSLEKLRKRYQHRQDVLDRLIHQCKELYLLTYAGDNKHTQLAHDTLAPLLYRIAKESDRPGQRALRILENKVQSYEVATETYLDLDDLEIVESGKNGMRLWKKKERELIDRSRERRKQLLAERRRHRNFKRGAISLLAIFTLVISLFAYLANRNAQANALTSQALSQETEDATLALRTAEKAHQKNPRNHTIRQVLADIYTNNEFYQLALLADTSLQSTTISPDGQVFAAIDAAGSWYTWNKKGELLQKVAAHVGAGFAIAFSPDGQSLLTAGEDGEARLWNLEGITERVFSGHQSAIHTVAFSPDGTQILTGSRDGEVRGWDKKGELLATFSAHQGTVYSITFSPEGRTFLTSGFDGEVILWDSYGLQLRSFIGHADRVHAVDFSKDGQYLLTASRDKTAILWDTSGQKIQQFAGHDARINAVAFSPDNRTIFTASDDRQILEWTLDGTIYRRFQGHHYYINDLSFTPDGEFMISASEDGTLKVWPLAAKEHRSFRHGEEGIGAVAISYDGQLIATAGYRVYAYPEDEILDQEDKGQDILIWHQDGRLLQTLTGHQDGIVALDFSSKGNLLLSGSKDGTARLWQVDTLQTEFKEPLSITAHGAEISALAFSPIGDQILTAGADSTARLWDLEGKELAVFRQHEAWVIAAAFSPDGKSILTGSMDGKARLWSLEFMDAAPLEIAGHTAAVVTVAFSPDGKYLLTGGEDNSARLWNIKGELLLHQTLAAQNISGYGAVRSVAFSPDGQFIALAGTDGSAWVFDRKGHLQQQIKAHTGSISTIRFSPSQDFIVTAGDDGLAKFNYLLEDFLELDCVAR